MLPPGARGFPGSRAASGCRGGGPSRVAPGGDQALHRPGGRLGVGFPAGLLREAAVGVLGADQVAGGRPRTRLL